MDLIMSLVIKPIFFHSYLFVCLFIIPRMFSSLACLLLKPQLRVNNYSVFFFYLLLNKTPLNIHCSYNLITLVVVLVK